MDRETKATAAKYSVQKMYVKQSPCIHIWQYRVSDATRFYHAYLYLCGKKAEEK